MMLSPEFRILSLNIHKGFALGPKRLVLGKIRQCLRDSGANIVFLQEVVGANHKHKPQVSSGPSQTQLEYLADTVWTHHAYGKNAIYQHGHHGNAILSELPFARWDNINASVLSFSQRGFLHGSISYPLEGAAPGEQAGHLHLICVHLGLFERERRLQIAHLVRHIRHSIPPSDPLILAGDFNDWRKTGHRHLLETLHLTEVHEHTRGHCARTYPAFLPVLAMDRIYVRGAQISFCESLAGESWREFSDHRALVADVRITR